MMKCLLLLISSMTLSGCVVVPKTVTLYDPDCDVEYRKLELSVEQFNVGTSGLNCNDNCGPLLVALALIPPASVVVSGSIVLVGNTVYWMEKRRACMG